MKDQALIYNFIGIWPSEKYLIKWIQLKWKPKGHIDLKLGAKGFFIVIFSSLEDKEMIFENGPFFYYNAGLFMRYWEECYNLRVHGCPSLGLSFFPTSVFLGSQNHGKD